ncbi:hypothetical protein [Flavobacterium sp. IMCC34518]|uniref:hypothetical protein n=1 Tax=Flavobacterium sp. IMCC34518 TaxID=3003623 RepID=UPI0022AC1170|nr:hypothetical protein [Flavobacterium sp. IMCC34518]
MKLKKLNAIKDPDIAMEKYEQSRLIKTKLDYKKWIEYVDSNQDYYTWYENTQSGIETKNRIDEVPEDFRDGVIDSLNKMKVCAEYNSKKGWYEIIIDFHIDYGVIHTTFMKKITKEHLKRLLDMADYLNAYLLNSRKTIIDKKVIDELE